MSVSSINNFNNLYNGKTQSFKGLWNKTSVSNDEDPGMGVFTNRETYYYHPFRNESINQISSVVINNSDAYVDTESKVYVIKECKVCTPLSFTKEQFEDYSNATINTEPTDMIKKTHAEVQDKYLDYHLGRQTSAVNKDVAKRLSLII